MKFRLIALASFLMVCFAGSAKAVTSTPYVTDQGKLELIAGGYGDDGKLYLGLHYDLKPGWHIYWRTPGDVGFPPTLDWQDSTNIANTQVLWPAPERTRLKISDDFTSESYSYEGNVVLPVLVDVKDKSAQTNIVVSVNYAICNDICIPESTNIELAVPASYSSVQDMDFVKSALKKIPAENGNNGINIEEINLGKNDKGEEFIQVFAKDNMGKFTNPTLFVEGGEGLSFYNPEINQNEAGNALEAVFKIGFLSDNKSLDGREFKITLVNGDVAIEKKIKSSDFGMAHDVSAMKVKTIQNGESLLLILLFGFLGGMILNVMPCVLPVLSIKLLGIIKTGGKSRGYIAGSFLITALGIIFSFLALAILVLILKNIGMNVGWGFQFQEPVFIIGLVVVLTFFAANMWGLFEVGIPEFIGSINMQKNDRHHFFSEFLTGVFATILATPCTAPFLGTAVGFALTRGYIEIISTFLAMGFGMAMPYIMLAVFPGLVSKMPKPGIWMIKLKKILGTMLAATAVWLIWVLSDQLGKTAALVLLALIIAKLLKLWAANHLKFLAEKKIKLLILVSIVVLAFVLPLKVSNIDSASVMAAEGNLWEPFVEDDIKSLVEHGKVVFVDVTADWCLTCKVNKLLILESDDVQKQFMQLDVVAMLADWTNKDGDIEMYLKKNNRAGIPFYAVYGPGLPNGKVLPELLSKQIVIDAVKQAAGNSDTQVNQ